MKNHLSGLGEHLTALEAEIAVTAPDYQKVSAHASEILTLSAGMSAMPGKAKAHTRK